MITTENSKQIGERIRKIRVNLGLSQAEMATLVGLKAASSVSDYEKGKMKRFTPEILDKIAKVGNVPADWILTGTNTEKPAPNDHPNGIEDNNLIAYVEARFTDDIERAAVLTFLKSTPEKKRKWLRGELDEAEI